MKLLLRDSTEYLKLLGREERYALLDGMATLGPYKPEPKKEETWRTELRRRS